METKTTVLADNLWFPEGPRWHEDKLWFTDLFAGRIMNADLHGNVQTVAEISDVPSAVGWTPEGQMLVVSATERRLLSLQDGGLEEVANLSGLVQYPMNDMVVDGEGRAYIGNMGFNFGEEQSTSQPGLILLVTPQGSARIVAEGLAFPNGLVITPDGETLIVAESHAARLMAFHIEPDGSLSRRRVWAQFDEPGAFGTTEGQITPDGISLDAEGAIWVASPNTKEVLRVREGAEVTQRVLIDGIPLACMLGGPDRDTLFILSTESLEPEGSQATGRIVTLPVAVPGAGLP